MLFPKLALGILFTAIGFISFVLPQNESLAKHGPLAYLLPYITTTPIKKEIAKTMPAKSPAHVTPTIVANTLKSSIPITPTPTTSRPVPTHSELTPHKAITQSTPIVGGDTPTPTSPMQQQPTNDVLSFIMQAINEYRHSNGLGSVTTNSLTCTFAATRAQEITTNFSHDGFTNRLNSHTMPYPNYSLITENIAQTSNYKEVVTLWANSPGHAENMRADTPYICVEQNGDYYAMEGWKPL